MIGYGAMLMESFVAIMAMIAAAALQPGIYFAINSPAGIAGATPEAAHAGGGRGRCKCKADEGRCQDRNQGSHGITPPKGRPQLFLTS